MKPIKVPEKYRRLFPKDYSLEAMELDTGLKVAKISASDTICVPIGDELSYSDDEFKFRIVHPIIKTLEAKK